MMEHQVVGSLVIPQDSSLCFLSKRRSGTPIYKVFRISKVPFYPNKHFHLTASLLFKGLFSQPLFFIYGTKEWITIRIYLVGRCGYWSSSVLKIRCNIAFPIS
jgi:hypothetical protein